MQSVSSLYISIRDSLDYYVETNLIICDKSIPISSDYTNSTHRTLNQTYAYDEEQILDLSTTRNVFTHNAPEVGCCTCGEIDVSMLKPQVRIPPMARLTPYVRLVSNGSLGVSEWIRKGVFFIDTRNVTKNDDNLNILTLHGYDSMMKANANYSSSSNLSVPDITAVREIASVIGVEVDPRTVEIISKNYTVLSPTSYTMIEVLGQIASAYGGNFIINDIGKLQLIPLWNLPPESNLLTDENYFPITFGRLPDINEPTRIDLGDEE